jgi:hypothetical protein
VRNVPPRGLAYTPDGAYLVVALNDRTVRFIAVSEGEEVGRVTRNTDLLDLTVSPDSRRIAVSGVDGTTSIWLWKREDLLNAAMERLTRNLTAEEWQQYFGDEPYTKICDHLPAHESLLGKAIELIDDGRLEAGRALLERAARIDRSEIGEVALLALAKLDHQKDGVLSGDRN